MCKRRILVCLLALMILFTGCAKDGSSSKQNISDKNVEVNEENKSVEEDSEMMTPLGKYPEMITMRVARQFDPARSLPEGQTSDDNIMLDLIRERLNIDIKIVWQAEGNEYGNKLAMNIATGDIPDMFLIPGTDYLTFRQMERNDLLADLTEAYEKCAGTYLKEVMDSYEGRNLKPLTIDGKLKGLSSANIGYGHNLLWLRSDWMEKLNLEAPKSIEDIEHILKEFIDKDPGGNGAGNTVGLALNATNPVGGYANKFGAEPIFHSFGAYPRQWMKDENGKIYYGSISPEVKEGLTVLRDWYSKGLIDKQFLTRIGSGETDALVNSGTSGAAFGPWWSIRDDAYKNNPEVKFMAVNAPLDAQGKYNYLTPSPTSDVLVVNKEYKHPEAMIKIVNLEFDIYRGFDKEGLEATNAIFDEGVDRIGIFPTGGYNLDYYDIVPRIGEMTKKYVETGELEEFKGMTDYDRRKAEAAKRFAEGKSSESTIGPDFKEYYGRYIGSNILKNPENNPVHPAYSYVTESSVSLKPALDKLEDQMYLQIITGEKSIDYFDEFVEQWYKIGGEALTKEVEEAVKELE